MSRHKFTVPPNILKYSLRLTSLSIKIKQNCILLIYTSRRKLWSLWLLFELIFKTASVKLGLNKMRWDVFKDQSI